MSITKNVAEFFTREFLPAKHPVMQQWRKEHPRLQNPLTVTRISFILSAAVCVCIAVAVIMGYFYHPGALIAVPIGLALLLTFGLLILLARNPDVSMLMDKMLNASKILDLSLEEFVGYTSGRDLSDRAGEKMKALADKLDSTRKAHHLYHPDLKQAQADFEEADKVLIDLGLIEDRPYASYFE